MKPFGPGYFLFHVAQSESVWRRLWTVSLVDASGSLSYHYFKNFSKPFPLFNLFKVHVLPENGIT